MTYKVELFGDEIPLNKRDFVKINNSLSKKYVAETDPAKRRAIAETLFRVDKALFRVWKVWDPADRGDYEQEAYLWTYRALETFSPGKGSFVGWLRWYVMQAQAEYGAQVEDRAKEGATLPDEANMPHTPPAQGDPLFWESLRGYLSAPEWRLLSLRFLEGRDLAYIAGVLKAHIPTISRRIASLGDKIRLWTAKNSDCASKGAKASLHNGYLHEQPADFAGVRWITKVALCDRLGISMGYLSLLLSPRADARRCPLEIDRRDVLKVQGVRVRYLEDARGLVYPRLLRRAQPTPPPPEGIPGKATGGGSVSRTGGPLPSTIKKSTPPHNRALELPPPIRPRGRPRKYPPPV